MDARLRLRKACDGCSIRKVKCDESGPPCQSCAKLDIPCTYSRPSRRRGPPNRHAEAIKKKQRSTSTSADSLYSPDQISSSSPPLPSSFGNQFPAPRSAEAICSFPTLRLLIDDYFAYIHPLVPVPHEPTFRAALERRHDVTDHTFLALVASMIGVLVTSFPRRPKLRLRTEDERAAFPNSISLVKRCHDITLQARGIGYHDRPATVYDAATSYNLSLISSYVYSIRRARSYLNECQGMVNLYRLAHQSHFPDKESVRSPSHTSLTGAVQGQSNLIERELGRRLYYLCFVFHQTAEQLACDSKTYVRPETPTDRYPPLPLEIDDEYIFPSHFEPQPAGVVSQLVGFNANIKVFKTCNDILAWEVAFGTGPLDWERRRTIIQDCLRKAKTSLDDVPEELTLRIPRIPEDAPKFQDQRIVQYEIQKANVNCSQLCTRSYLVEKYWNLYESYKMCYERDHRVILGMKTDDSLYTHAETDPIGRIMAEERRQVICDLLLLLQSVNQVNMQPNGASIGLKVRHIASTLLNLIHESEGGRSERPAPGPSYPLSLQEAYSYLQVFINTLMHLEGAVPVESESSGPNGSTNMQRGMSYASDSNCDEEEVRQWANLRECQKKFAETELIALHQ